MNTLKEQLVLIEARLDRIERRLGLGTTDTDSSGDGQDNNGPCALVSPTPRSTQLPASAKTGARAAGAADRVYQPAPSAVGPTNVMAWGAGIAFLLATVYFLKLVYDSGWLTPVNQMALATLAGVLFIAAGIGLAERDRHYAAYLPAFGMSILYLTAYVGYMYYRFLTVDTAIVSVSLVSVAGIWLDRRFRHSVYIIFATAGVYLSPLLVNVSAMQITDLVIYYTAWSLLFSFCAIQEKRRLVYVLALFFSMIGFDIAWRHAAQDNWVAAAVFQLLQFMLFALTAAYLSIRDASPMSGRLAVTHGIALLYFYTTQYSLVYRHSPELAPWLALASAVFLLVLLLVARHRLPADHPPQASAVLVSAYCCMVSTHVIFFEWLPEEWLPWGALVLSAAAIQVFLRFARGARAFYPVLVMAGLLFLWGFICLLPASATHEVPGASLALAAYAGLLYLGYFGLARDFTGARYATGLLYAAHLALMVLTVRELDSRIAVSLVWAVLAIALLFIAIMRKDRALGSSSLLVFTASGLKVLLYDLSNAGSGVRVLTLLILGVSLYVGGWLYQQLGRASVRYHPNPEVNRQLNAIRAWVERGMTPEAMLQAMATQRMHNLDGKPWTTEQLQKIIRDYRFSVA